MIQSAQSIKDLLFVLKGPIRRAPAKKINEAIQGFVQATLDEFNSTSISRKQIFKMGLKDEVLALVYLIRANEVAGIGECWGYGAPTSFYMLAGITSFCVRISRGYGTPTSFIKVHKVT